MPKSNSSEQSKRYMRLKDRKVVITMALDRYGRPIYKSEDEKLREHVKNALTYNRGISENQEETIRDVDIPHPAGGYDRVRQRVLLDVYELNRENARVIANYFENAGTSVPYDVQDYLDHPEAYRPHDLGK